MREVLTALETLRAVPSNVVERPKPISLPLEKMVGSSMWLPHAAPLLTGIGQDIAHEVHLAAVPGGMQHLGDRRASERRNSVQNVSASETPIEMPSTSRRPSPLTATATITATATMLHCSRTLT
jgi:hypothetical protein